MKSRTSPHVSFTEDTIEILWREYTIVFLNGKKLHLHNRHTLEENIKRAIRAHHRACIVQKNYHKNIYVPLLEEASKAEFVPVPLTLESSPDKASRGRNMQAYSVTPDLSYSTRWLCEQEVISGSDIKTDEMFFDLIESLEDKNSLEHLGNKLYAAEDKNTRNRERCWLCKTLIVHLLQVSIREQFNGVKFNDYTTCPIFTKVCVTVDGKDRTFLFKLTHDYIYCNVSKIELVYDSDDITTEYTIL